MKNLLLFLFWMSLGHWAYAQDRTLTGAVSGDDNLPIPGASVSVKGTTRGATTNAEGRYTLSGVPASATTLVFSSVGYESQELPIGSSTTLNAVLKATSSSLNEVVVVGYGTQKKETVTGAITQVKGDELVKSPSVNLSNSLAGRLPGVTAMNGSGEPGNDGSSIRIRGLNTLNNNDVLVVIDGIPARAGGFDRINPADIETFSVLKDAAAAIYGSRAANGVILITTKKGKLGKPQLSYSFNQGFANPTVIPKLANASQYVQMLNELDIYGLPVAQWAAASQAYKTTGTYTQTDGKVRTAPYLPADIALYENGTDPWLHPNTDWYAAALKKNAPQRRHTLQMSGGSENIRYLASLGYQFQDAYYKNSATQYRQYDIRLNMDADVNKYVHVNIGLLGREEARAFPTKGAGTIFRMLMRGKPQQQAYWPDGRPGPDIENGENPVVVSTDATGYDRDNSNYIQTNGVLDIKIPGIEGLKFTGTAAVDKMLRSTKRWETPWTLYELGTGKDAAGNPNLVASKRGPAEPRLTQAYYDQLNILLGGVMTYEKKFGEHNFLALLGTNRETIKGSNFSAYRRYFISPSIDQLFAGGALEQNSSGGAFTRARINYFGRITYNYKERYLFELLGRYDGSDIFPAATRYGFFPGVLAGWTISEEPFWKNNVRAVSYLKLRGSWGQLGNDQVYLPNTTVPATYQYLSTYGFSSYILGNVETKTLYEARVPNTSITWEVANNANIGLDGELWNGRVFWETDVFYNKRTNILWFKNASIPQSTGMTLPAQNIGSVANRGFEFNIGTRQQSGDFRYSFAVNGGYAKNKILFWDEAPGAPAWQRSTGRPMFTPVVYLYDGVFKDQAAIDANKLDYSAIVKNLRPGDMKYKDYDGDGKITPDDRVRLDQSNVPIFTGGANLTASWRNFDLTVLLQGAAGAKAYVSTGESGNIGNFLLDVYENRWSVDNPSDVHPRIANRSDQYYSGGNTYWLRSTDYMRLKNVEVGYNLSPTLTERIGIKGLRIYANALNMLTFSSFNVYDPEASSSTGQYYPQQKIINFGLTARF